MYRISLFTYRWHAIHGHLWRYRHLRREWISRLTPPGGQNCDVYMSELISQQGGYLLNANSTTEWTYCKIDNTDQFLSIVSSNFGNAWRNFGFMWLFIAFNCLAAVGLYWAFRVPKDNNTQDNKDSEAEEKTTERPRLLFDLFCLRERTYSTTRGSVFLYSRQGQKCFSIPLGIFGIFPRLCLNFWGLAYRCAVPL